MKDTEQYIWVKKTYNSRDSELANRIILHKFGSKIIGAFKYIPMKEEILPEGLEEVSPEEELICDRHNKITSYEPSEIKEETYKEFYNTKDILNKKLDKEIKEENNINELPNNW